MCNYKEKRAGMTVEEDQLHFCFSLGLRSFSGSSAQRTTWWLEGGTNSRMSWSWRGTSTKVRGLSLQMNHCLLWTHVFVVFAGDVYVHADLHGATSVVVKNHSGQLWTARISFYYFIGSSLLSLFPLNTFLINVCTSGMKYIYLSANSANSEGWSMRAKKNETS